MYRRLSRPEPALPCVSLFVGLLLVVLSGVVPGVATATTLTEIGSFSGAVTASADAASTQADGNLLVRAFTSAVAPTSQLFALTPGGVPAEGVTVPYVYGASISPNGRFDAWADAPCDRVAHGPTHPIRFHLLDTSLAGATPRTLVVPRRYAHSRVEALGVSSGGRVTALLSTYNTDCYAAGMFDASPGDGAAILSASPGDAALHVIVSAVLHAGSSPVVSGAVYTLGDVAASPLGDTFAMCFLPRISARTADLVEVINRDALTIRRTSASTGVKHAIPECAASDAGTATMLLTTRGHERFVSTGRGLRHDLRARTDGAFFGLNLSPSGGAVADGGIVNLSTGQETPEAGPHGYNPNRNSLNVPATNGLNAFEPFDQPGDFNSVVSWATPTTILSTLSPNSGTGRHYLLLLNRQTGRWSKPLYFENVDGQHFATYCGLSTGRVLLGIGTDGGYGRPNSYRVFLSDRGATRFTALNTAALGQIHAISCGIPAGRVYVSVGTYPARLLTADATAIDGSSWAG
jgi:hypothetical protein